MNSNSDHQLTICQLEKTPVPPREVSVRQFSQSISKEEVYEWDTMLPSQYHNAYVQTILDNGEERGCKYLM